MDLNNIWNSFLEKIKIKVADIAFETWFKDTSLISLDNNKATVLVPFYVHKKMLKENYNDLIEEIFNEVTGTNFEFIYVIEDDIQKNVEINEPEEESIGLPNNLNFDSNLDSRYTFDSFIVGPSNKFAATSAFAVAEKPGKMYNPLFIYGSSGLGKTHLMHAIGNYVKANSNKKVLYITCDNFVSDFVEICRKNNNTNNAEAIKIFKNKYRDIDVLIIDDIHNLVGAISAQQEFFNTFNELYNNEKQIIISSDRSPDDIKKLEERLKTRFNWGLTVNILPPDFNLRMSILNKKIDNHELATPIPEEVKEYIASNCIGDIRKLEGAITRVLAYAAIMNNSNITLDLTIEALTDYFVKTVISKNKMDQVIQIVSQHYNLPVEALKSKRKTNNIAIPRQIAMYICRVYLDENLTKIGAEFGGKNHTTVIHSVEKIKKELLTNNDLNNEIKKIINEIN